VADAGRRHQRPEVRDASFVLRVAHVACVLSSFCLLLRRRSLPPVCSSARLLRFRSGVPDPMPQSEGGARQYVLRAMSDFSKQPIPDEEFLQSESAQFADV
jgi:hypothetical protein